LSIGAVIAIRGVFRAPAQAILAAETADHAKGTDAAPIASRDIGNGVASVAAISSITAIPTVVGQGISDSIAPDTSITTIATGASDSQSGAGSALLILPCAGQVRDFEARLKSRSARLWGESNQRLLARTQHRGAEGLRS